MVARVTNKPFLLDRRLIALTVFGFLCAIILAGLVNLSINTLSGVRAYVSGEGKWAKAQKQSLIYLTNYIYTGDDDMYQLFIEANDVIMGNMEARLEMINERADPDIVNMGLLRGFNHPDDIPDMVNVYRRFKWVPQVERAFKIWNLGDEKNMELIAFADAARSMFKAGTVSPELQAQWVAAIIDYERTFHTMEIEFADSMREMAGLVNKTMRWSSISLAFILCAFGGFLLMRFARSTKAWARDLRENEEKLSAMLNNSRDVLYKMNLATERYEYVSEGLTEMLGYDTKEFLEGGPQWIYSKIHPEDKENMAKVMKRYKSINKDHFAPMVEFRMLDKSGNYKWVSNSRTLMKKPDGTPEAIVGMVRDISAIKEQEEQLRKSLTEKEILLQEIHHRVKNNLSIVISLLELQKDGMSPKVQEMLSDSQSQIKSIAKVHEKLYKSTTLAEIPMDVYIQELAEEISKSYESNKKDIKIEVVAAPYTMDLNSAIPFGLVINELVNNSYKHGFKGLKKGIVRISLQDKPDCMELVVANNGNKLKDDFDPAASKSLGMTLVQVLIQRFEGKLSVEQGDWTEFKICF